MTLYRYVAAVLAGYACGGMLLAGESTPKDAGHVLAIDAQVEPARAKPGDRVTLKIGIRNTSSEKVAVSVQRLTRLGFVRDQPLRLVVRDETNNDVRVHSMKISAIPPIIRKRILDPNQTVNLEYGVFDILPLSTKAGKVTFVAEYRDGDIQVKSQPVVFEVMPSSGDESKAIQLYEEAMRGGRDEVTLAKLQRIRDEYPEAPVTLRATELLADRLWKRQRDKAVEIWRELLRSKKASYTTRWKLAQTLASQGKLRDAMEVLDPVDEDGARARVRRWRAMSTVASRPASQPAAASRPASQAADTK